MRVEVGNNCAIEGSRDNPDGELTFSAMEGERITTLIVPDEMSIVEAYQTVVATIPAHMEPGASPVWIESDNPALQAILCEHYGLPVTSSRPPTWGAVKGPMKTASKAKKATKKTTASQED